MVQLVPADPEARAGLEAQASLVFLLDHSLHADRQVQAVRLRQANQIRLWVRQALVVRQVPAHHGLREVQVLLAVHRFQVVLLVHCKIPNKLHNEATLSRFNVVHNSASFPDISAVSPGTWFSSWSSGSGLACWSCGSLFASISTAAWGTRRARRTLRPLFATLPCWAGLTGLSARPRRSGLTVRS